MGSHDKEFGAAAVEGPTGIAIEADATLGHASIQNSVPILRSLRLTNHGTEPVETCDPSRDIAQFHGASGNQ